MKVFIVLSAILAAAAARPQLFAVRPLALPTQQQYHAQDELGQYSYGYSDALSAKQEVKTFDGVTRGSYSYRDAEGKLQTVDYTADAMNGFRVAATNLPKALPLPEYEQAAAPLPVADTAEVAAAKVAHYAAVEEAKIRTPLARVAIERTVEIPRPVEDTAEVAKAKLEHYAALEAAKLRNANEIRYAAAPIVAPLALRSNILPAGFSYAVDSPYFYNSRFLASHSIYQ